jgi:EAL domain-containing protein (putative c-di-GMP-specific phosphodiesterase class I)
VGDYPGLRRALARLPARVSVDDAGAGFSTLRHVMLLEPDYVKLDRSWVPGIDNDPARQALVAGIVHYTRVTGAHLVAEGVETEPELAWLRWLEVELAQGYLLGRPAPVDAWAEAR